MEKNQDNNLRKNIKLIEKKIDSSSAMKQMQNMAKRNKRELETKIINTESDLN